MRIKYYNDEDKGELIGMIFRMCLAANPMLVGGCLWTPRLVVRSGLSVTIKETFEIFYSF